MNYLDRIAQDIEAECEGICIPEDDETRLWRIYTVLALTLGTATTNRAVHEAWSAWMAGKNPSHGSLVPFEELTPEVQEQESPYRDAIIRVARRLNHAS